MSVIQGGHVMEGVGQELPTFYCAGDPNSAAGAPSGPLPGAQCYDTTNGHLYINQGTAAAPLWYRASGIEVEERTFTQTSAAGVYTGSVTVPAGATIIDIKFFSTVLWNAGTSSTLKVGDAADDDGWFVGIDLQATDLLVGEELNFENAGGKPGAYLVLASGTRSAAYSASARVVSGIITQVGTGTAGRSRMLVLYSLPLTSAATKV